MRIAIFTDTYIPEINGVVTSIKNFTELLADDGHEILIFCPKYKTHRENSSSNIRVLRYAAFSFITNKSTRIAFPSIVNILDELREFNPDIIHVQTPMSIGMVGLWAAKLLNVPSVQTYHTYIPDFMIYLMPKNIFGITKISDGIKNSKIFERVLQSEVAQSLKRMRVELSDLVRFSQFIEKRRGRKAEKVDLSAKFAWNYTRFLYNRSDMVLTPSQALKDELKKHGISVPIVVQSNGIELDNFKVKDDYSRKNRILHFGRLGPEKNVDVILKAFAKMDNKNVTLDIMGDGPAKKTLTRLSKKLKINDRVKFLGFVSRKQLINSLNDYDMFVTASTMETQGLVILEAMASGLPIVGADKLAVPEVVKDGSNGFIFKPGDSHAMAIKMDLLLENEKLREKMGNNSLKIVGTHELTVVAEKLENTYRRVIDSNSLVSSSSK